MLAYYQFNTPSALNHYLLSLAQNICPSTFLKVKEPCYQLQCWYTIKPVGVKCNAPFRLCDIRHSVLSLPSKANSRQSSSQNISVKQHCPSPLSVCTVCVCVRACIRVCILHIVMLEHLMSTLNNIVQPKKRSYFASHLIFSCFSPFTCWLSVVL